ncbi:helix-turn-helix domain-containing protein [Kibdelosporangium banguiense]
MIPEHRSAGSGDGRSANTAGDARCEARARRLEQRAELPRIAWSAAEFAEMVGLSADCVRELLRNGEIPATKFGQQWRIADSYVQQVRGGGPNRPVTA